MEQREGGRSLMPVVKNEQVLWLSKKTQAMKVKTANEIVGRKYSVATAQYNHNYK